MKDKIDDLRKECAALDMFLAGLAPQDWSKVTAFFGWTVADEVMHLRQVVLFGILALTAPDLFAALVEEVRAGQARGFELSDRMREQWGQLPPAEIRANWCEDWQRICALFEATAPETRLPWFGPPMAASAFVTARQMEVWAHGQDIYDLFKLRRVNDDRIRNICELGVRTHGWSFGNRGLERPLRPEVRLTAPSGAVWVWNEGEAERISGPAEDFALVVTQRRNVADTALAVEGEGARAWMEIAQCFAGVPEQMPAPGQRLVVYGPDQITAPA